MITSMNGYLRNRDHQLVLVLSSWDQVFLQSIQPIHERFGVRFQIRQRLRHLAPQPGKNADINMVFFLNVNQSFES